MKYPQLVSSRAVNEISDWLIKRLEDLDIEQPSVYSRLLLSLLHTPFKVNAIDLLEIPQLKDLKLPYHLLNKNNEELKRLTAVESLMEVSTEENKSNIISLVDELHSKLRKIENSCEDNSVIGRSTNVVLSSTSPVTSSSTSKFYKNLKKIKRNHGTENPTKNYYLAFPALSSGKKALTSTITTTTITSGGENQEASSPGEVGETKKDSNMHQLLCWSNLMSSAKDNSQQSSCKNDTEKILNAVKIKGPRRKRRYGRYLNKQTDVQCYTKSFDTIHDGATFSSPKAKNGNKKHHKSQIGTLEKNPSTKASCNGVRNNNIYPSGSTQIWDMDFKGHWEMDRDLIGEFIQQQQQQQQPDHQKKIHKVHLKKAKSTSQVGQAMDDYDDDDDDDEDETDDDDNILMKFLPKKLMDDDPTSADATELLKSKFDANIKALWNDVDEEKLAKPLTYKMFNNNDGGNGCRLVNSFSSERNSFALFNFNVHQPHPTMEVVAPSAANNLQMYNNHHHHHHHRNISDFDYNNNSNNNNGSAASFNNNKNHQHHYTSAISPGAEKFIKSGTNLQASIWSDGEFSCEPESFIYKDYTALREANDKTKNGHSMLDSMNDIDVLAIEKDAKKEDFSVRFVIKDENNKGCQTDINDLIRAVNNRSFLEINEDYCKRKIYDEYFKESNNNINNKWRYQLTADDSNDYSFFSVNRVKNPPVVPKTLQDILMSSNSSSSSICTITSSSYETSAVDPFESWRSIKVDNGGMLDSNYKQQTCMHSLWEQCNACNRNDYDRYYEEKTIPANRLMKDELRMDGDEIMNVIQNLYITGDYCDDEEEKDEDDYEDMNHLYMDMLDDSMDGSGIAEEESKFYEASDELKGDNVDEKEGNHFTPNMFENHRREELLQLENFDEITMAKMQWQWDKNREAEKDQEKYLKLLKWIQASLRMKRMKKKINHQHKHTHTQRYTHKLQTIIK
ncbi:CLUMA_CG017164, isoform A [Clunio marinus]|uniref:CLUMA_CG017164, isoform A n=1 Tax=Clunio marinus TaxID=568069 RepID=A0A1J1IUX7_9DIPT|nr:CLUMA_CG017164, isoform A [Clunio marinus]